MLCSAITPLRGLFTLYSYPCNYDLGDSISTAKPTIGDAVDLLLVFTVNTRAVLEPTFIGYCSTVYRY